jgi:hypothetical protein
MRLSPLTLAAAALVGSIASAHALPPVRAGVLECRGGQNVGFVVGSVASLDCVYRSEGGRPEAYVATVHRFGLDLGITEQSRFTWAVNAPTSRFGRGELAGTYGGVSANASVGVGGPSNAYALQPISVQGQTGFNVAAGAADLELEPVQTAPGLRFHHHIHHMRYHRG